MNKLLAAILLALLLFGCRGQRQEQLLVGIIQPSIDHLPYSLALEQGALPAGAYRTVSFTSGWELNEALCAGRVDVAILPFSYVWNAVAAGYPVKTVSFLERETDAVIAIPEIASAQELKGRRVGLLKASTLDLLWRDYAQEQGIEVEPVYFRSPNELIAALQRGDIAAASLYEPLITRLKNEFKVLHWYGERHPGHPCCDVAVNRASLNPAKTILLKELLATLSDISDGNSEPDSAVLDYVSRRYGLDEAGAGEALRRSGFQTGLQEEGIQFERQMMLIALQQGYLKRIPEVSEVFWDMEADQP